MVDTHTYTHVQWYRERYYQAKAAVEQVDSLDMPPEAAHKQYHMVTEGWVQRLLPLDSVENLHQDIWHNRQMGDFEGLKEAYDDGLRRSFGDFQPLPTDVLAEIGEAIDEISVDAAELPPQPPIEPEPLTPGPLSDETKELLDEVKTIARHYE